MGQSPDRAIYPNGIETDSYCVSLSQRGKRLSESERERRGRERLLVSAGIKDTQSEREREGEYRERENTEREKTEGSK